jgi:hypothetical protein
MAVDSTRQICGNCGALNAPDAVVCVVCGALLAAYAAPPEPEPIEPTRSTTTTTTTTSTTPRPTPSDRQPATTGTDWRGMFESTPGRLTGTTNPLQDLERNFRDDLPQSKATPNQAPEAKPDERTQRLRERPAVETPAPTTTPPPVQPQKQEAFPGQQRRIKEARGRAARVQPSNNRPGTVQRFNRRRPQSMITGGVIVLLLGCVVTVFLSSAGASDVLVAGAFLCLMPLGFIAIVAGIVISVSRKEGRGG